ncbi:MAG: hypothetical protein QNJ53_02350 [Pleurocapsa sp. MO_192.B19]|nr:hypothetical protein [Pleurocapsa sp. MO_192.B19]
MKKSIFLITALLTIIPISLVEAQTTSYGVNQILDETDQLIKEVEPQIEQLEAEGREYQSYLNSLYENCINGDSSACEEHNRRLAIQNQILDGAIRQTDPNSPRNRSWAESFCHPYCSN